MLHEQRAVDPLRPVSPCCAGDCEESQGPITLAHRAAGANTDTGVGTSYFACGYCLCHPAAQNHLNSSRVLIFEVRHEALLTSSLRVKKGPQHESEPGRGFVCLFGISLSPFLSGHARRQGRSFADSFAGPPAHPARMRVHGDGRPSFIARPFLGPRVGTAGWVATPVSPLRLGTMRRGLGHVATRNAPERRKSCTCMRTYTFAA